MTDLEFSEFYDWCETIDFGSYDRDQVIPDSLDNVGDVPSEDKLRCAKTGVLMYLDGCFDDY